MKRYLSLAMILLMLPAFLAVPAMAAESPDLIEVLNYGFPNGGMNTNVGLNPNNNTVSFNLPYTTQVFYIDILLTSTSLQPSAVYLVVKDNEVKLEKINVYGNIYRLYGDGINSITSSFTLRFEYPEGSTGNNWVTFKSVKVSLVPLQYQDVNFSGNVVDLSGSIPVRHQFTTSSPSVSWEIESNADFDRVYHINMSIPESDWTKYDYIDLQFTGTFSELTSLVVQIGSVFIPYSLTYLGQMGQYQDVYYNMRLDLTGVNRANGEDLTIDSTGLQFTAAYNKFSVYSCVGFILDVPDNMFTYWFNQLLGGIGNGFNSVITNIANWGQNLLDGINALPDKIAEALESVFVPSDSVVQNMGQQSEELAQDRFGGAYEGALIIDEFASQLRPQQATQILTVPVVNLDILGVPFPLGGWEVDLVPDGAELIVETCKILIDIVATLAFVNGLRNRLERTLEK